MVHTRKLTKEEISVYLSVKNHIRPNIDYGDSHVFIRSMIRDEYMSHRKKVNYADASVYSNVDKIAEFGGGQIALLEYLKENLKYPESAKEKRIECSMKMSFVINHSGGLVYLNVEQEPELSDENLSIEFQRAAFYAIQGTNGKWQPAEKDGKYVMSKMTLPIEFKLDN